MTLPSGRGEMPIALPTAMNHEFIIASSGLAAFGLSINFGIMIGSINQVNWAAQYTSLNEKGYCIVPGVLSKKECDFISELYQNDELYRTTINMQRFRFGKGEYKYFNYPLPEPVQTLRDALYRPLAVLANEWMKCLGLDARFPSTHNSLLEECKANGQLRPTPLILKYETGGFNALHQDLYGKIYFPFQVVLVLSESGKDYEGGEFVLVEQMPRAQSRAEVICPHQGDALIITTNFRPVKGTRGYYRAKMKHGVSPLKSGTRYAMGIIFHDAK